MKNAEHWDNGSLIRYLDGELAESAMVEVGNHLMTCATCRHRCNEFAAVSSQVEALADTQPTRQADNARQRLAVCLAYSTKAQPDPDPSKILKRFGWGMALAATFALGLLILPTINRAVVNKPATRAPASVSSIDVDGESFIALPYSNPDLPLNAPRVVEMQVPVSSLEAAGIFFQPSPNAPPDRTVLANVLLGIDGQPLGVHVLSAD